MGLSQPVMSACAELVAEQNRAELSNQSQRPIGSPHVIGGAIEDGPLGLADGGLCVRDGEARLSPVLVLHHGGKVLVHVVHGQHGHLE